MRRLCVGMVVLLCYAASAGALPFRPTDDQEVLEQLPVASARALRQARDLRRQLAERPREIKAATNAAWLSINKGRELGDPRYYGYAQAALTPWWNMSEPP